MIKNTFCLLFVCCLSVQGVAQTTAQTLRSHVEYLASDALEGRGPGTDGKDMATAYIVQEFLDAGLQPFSNAKLQVPFEYGMGQRKTMAHNVIGFLPGTDANLRDEYIVLGAHYDHLGMRMRDGEPVIYNGADDNASGTATLIKLAKHFSQPENRPARSLIFAAFDAEELGLFGSKDFVKNLSEEQKKQIKKMFSFDMVGMLGANDGLDLKGIASLKGGEKIAKDLARAERITLKNTTQSIEQRTDTAPFGSVGIPAAHFFTGTKSPYHKPEDTAEKLDYEGMERVFNFSTALISELGNTTVLEKTNRMQRIADGKMVDIFTGGLMAGLGSGLHKYPDEFYNAKPAFVFGGGVRMNLKLSRRLALNGEAWYNGDASKSEAGTYRRYSITVPVTLELGINNQNDANVFLGAGVYYRFNQSGTDGDRSLNFDHADNINDLGIALSFGADVQKWRIGLQSRYGLQSIYTDDRRVLANETMFVIGYRLW